MIKNTSTRLFFFSMTIIMGIAGCAGHGTKKEDTPSPDTLRGTTALMDTVTSPPAAPPESVRMVIDTKEVRPDSLLAFARTLIGVPYLYASTDPAKGFDCSGFITYVFNHFNITVPRSSVDFTDMGTEIDIEDSKPGDLILFTGTDSTIHVVGHMGLVENTSDHKLYFLHSTSGKGGKA